MRNRLQFSFWGMHSTAEGVYAITTAVVSPSKRDVKRNNRSYYIFCAVHVPWHIAPCQVPEPEVPERRPKPTACLRPRASDTLIEPESATWPDAVIMPPAEATRPLLIPKDAVAPSPHCEFDEAMCTLHSPSKLAAAAGLASGKAKQSRTCVVTKISRNRPMTCPFCF